MKKSILIGLFIISLVSTKCYSQRYFVASNVSLQPQAIVGNNLTVMAIWNITDTATTTYYRDTLTIANITSTIVSGSWVHCTANYLIYDTNDNYLIRRKLQVPFYQMTNDTFRVSSALVSPNDYIAMLDSVQAHSFKSKKPLTFQNSKLITILFIGRTAIQKQTDAIDSVQAATNVYNK